MSGENQKSSVILNESLHREKLDQLLTSLHSMDPSSSTRSLEETTSDENGQLAAPGSLCTITNLYEGPQDRRGRSSWTTTYPDDIDEPPENAVSARAALLVRNKKCYDGKRKLTIDSIVVQSMALKTILGYVLDGYPGIQTTDLERLEFRAPFQPFVHRWEKLLLVRSQLTDTRINDHMNLLYSVLEEELRETLREKSDHVSHGIAAFDSVWTIFEPGCLIYARENGYDRVYKLTSGQVMTNHCGTFYYLRLKYVDYDGERFGLCDTSISIPKFSGTSRITDLVAYPLKFHVNTARIQNKLIARGKVFESYQGFHFKHYDGITTIPGRCGPIKLQVNSRVIVDSYAFNQFNPNRKLNLEYLNADQSGSISPSDSEWETNDEGYFSRSSPAPALSDDHLLLCSHKLRGYSLKNKIWLELWIDEVHDITWNDHAFDSLVAPPEQKELILAFVQSQAANKFKFDDVIQGKGKGIIFLLSGPPGVGKTLTAESVAETMRVPLYTMSAGDLGTKPSDVEEALSKILQMNQKWNSVLLLDEADVFLEARSTHDLERNKLVSIFLRLLEYYEGTLFLTTNRVDNIDAAFESRIHLSLQYNNLDFTSRRHVWTTFLSRSSGAVEFTPEQLDKLAETELNGRQIKNILKTAHLLASKQESALSFAQVDTVMRLRAANMPKA